MRLSHSPVPLINGFGGTAVLPVVCMIGFVICIFEILFIQLESRNMEFCQSRIKCMAYCACLFCRACSYSA